MYDGTLTYCYEFMDILDKETSKPTGRVEATISVGNTKHRAEIEFDPNKVEVLHFDSHYFNLTEELTKELPSLGMAMLFQRQAQRQNRRGLSTATCRLGTLMYVLYNRYGKSIYPNHLSPSFGIIECMQKPVYPTFADAFQKCKDFGSVAISPEFALFLNPYSNENYLLASKYGFIGEGTSRDMTIYHDASYQEFSDYLWRNKLYPILSKGKEIPYAADRSVGDGSTTSATIAASDPGPGAPAV